VVNCKSIQKIYKKSSRIPLASLNYHLGNYKEAIWLVSDGRSGSTWLSDLINSDRAYRELFEPFHPHIVKKAQQFSLFQYLRPEDSNSPLGNFLKLVFSGKFKHLRSDVSKPRLFYKGLLVKDIFAHLLMPWVNQNIPHVKKVLLIRNPFAVALSKQRLSKWTWMTEPRKFLEQQNLCDDYLAPFEDTICSVGDDFIEKQVLIWAIIHYVSIRSLSQDDVYIVFYENLIVNPEQEIEDMFSYLNKQETLEESLESRIYKPTRTSKSFHQNLSRTSLIDAWKDEISPNQIARGMTILQRFNLDYLYGDTGMPNREILTKCGFEAWH